MIIYPALDDAMAAEPGLIVTAQGETSPASHFERDWGGYRLRGAGLPGGSIGWLLTFAGQGSGWYPTSPGWLIAYEIVHNSKSGRIAVLRRNWSPATDEAERKRVIRDTSVWSEAPAAASSDTGHGEADLDVIDRSLSGTIL